MSDWFWQAVVLVAIPYVIALALTAEVLRAGGRMEINIGRAAIGAMVLFVIGVPALAAALGWVA
jgi:hypothetical protein